MMRWFKLCTCLVAFVLISPQSSDGVRLYWTWADSQQSHIQWLSGDPEQWVRSNSLHSNITDFENTILGRFDIDTIRNEIFIHDRLDGSLLVMNESTSHLKPFYHGSSNEVTDIAVDWVSHNIYYTDPNIGLGLVSYKHHISGPVWSTIVIRDIRASHLEVDPLHSYIFLVELSEAGTRTITRSGMLGENRTIVHQAMDIVHDLELDPVRRKLFWISEEPTGSGVWTAGYDGTDKRPIISGQNSSRLLLYDDYLCLVAASSNVLSFYNVTSGNAIGDVYMSKARIFGITFSGPQAQPSTISECDNNNGGCDHICIHRGASREIYCACDIGYQLDLDRKTCLSGNLTSGFLVVMDSAPGKIYQLGIETGKLYTIHKAEVTIHHMTYDGFTKTVYWSEGGAIWRKYVTNTEPELFFNMTDGAIITLEDIWCSSESRHIFFSDSGSQHIASLSIEQPSRPRVLINDVIKALIVGHDDTRAIAWISRQETVFSLHWTNMRHADSDDVQPIQLRVMDNASLPAAIAFDTKGMWIYLAEATGRITRASTDPNQDPDVVQTLALPNRSYITDLSLNESAVYIATTHTVYYMNLDGSDVKKLGPEILWDIRGIASGSVVISTPNVGIIFGSEHTVEVTIVGILIVLVIVVLVARFIRKRRVSPDNDRTDNGDANGIYTEIGRIDSRSGRDDRARPLQIRRESPLPPSPDGATRHSSRGDSKRGSLTRYTAANRDYLRRLHLKYYNLSSNTHFPVHSKARSLDCIAAYGQGLDASRDDPGSRLAPSKRLTASQSLVDLVNAHIYNDRYLFLVHGNKAEVQDDIAESYVSVNGVLYGNLPNNKTLHEPQDSISESCISGNGVLYGNLANNKKSQGTRLASDTIMYGKKDTGDISPSSSQQQPANCTASVNAEPKRDELFASRLVPVPHIYGNSRFTKRAMSFGELT